ncbi:hypothetical protein MMC07_001184 [Pseudocyphellaria aurata]|nr:hypothetical protein [Pseudocyphellaria aurata]
MKVYQQKALADRQESISSWMGRHSAEYHRGSNPSGSLQTQRKEPPAKKSSDDFTDDFCLLIQRYAETTQLKEHASSFNIRGMHSWDEVTQAANLAEEKYLKDAKGPKGSIRRFFRLTGDNARVIEPWVNLLPNDQYFSVLCGGLKLILGVAARRSEQREDILDTFKKVPEIVLRTQRYHELIPNDRVLQDCAFALYLALLEMISGMISSLVGKSLLTKVKEGFTGSLPDRSLDEIRKCYRKSEHDLQERLEYLKMSMGVSTNAAVARMESTVMRTDHTVSETHGLVQGMATQTSDIHARVHKMSEDFEGIRLQMAKQLEANYTLRQIEEHTKATNKLISLLQLELKSVEWRSSQQDVQFQSEARKLRLLGEPRSRSPSYVPNKWLQELLAVDLHTTTSDIEFMSQQGPHVNSLSQAQSRQLLSNPRFHHWIGSKNSDVLLIDGNSELYAVSKCSPMSSLCTALISGLAQQKQAQITYFFCGAHSTFGDPLGGPAGLVKCLIAQLLAVRDFDLGFMGSGQWDEQLQQDSLAALCRLFRELVAQFSDSILFCIIDGVSLLETERWRKKMQELLRSLTLLVGDENLSVVFKLLVTSPGVSRIAKIVIPPPCCIQISEDEVEDEVAAPRSLHLHHEMSYQTPPPRLSMGYSTRFLVHDSDAIEDDDNIFEHGCE